MSSEDKPVVKRQKTTGSDADTSEHNQSETDSKPPLSQDANSASTKQYKRSYKACLSCRTRKIKCDLGSPSNPMDPPCARCRRERKDCVFAESRRGTGSRKRKEAGNSHDASDGADSLTNSPRDPASRAILGGNNEADGSATSAANTFSHKANSADYVFPTIEQQRSIVKTYGKLPPRNNTSEVSTMQGALLFLANAAGTIAKADERDRLVRSKYTQNDPNRLSSTASSPHNYPYSQQSSPLLIPEGRTSSALKPIIPMTNLTDFDYIGEGKLLSEKEAIELVDFFFNYMHPFYPYIPPDLHDANTLTGYPILLCTILTIALRYKPLVDDNDPENDAPSGPPEPSPKVSKRLETHEKLWMYCQRLVSQSVWAEASTRSIGTVFSFLLFTEWNPRAIHWKWDDYANSGGFTGSSDGNTSNGSSKTTSPNSNDGDLKNNNDNDNSKSNSLTNDEDSLAGIGALRRSSRMSWMLCGTSIRLAQDMGFMENSSRVFVATHVSETSISMTIGQRSMLAQSLAEVNLNDDASFEDSYQVEDDMVLKGDEDALRLKTNTLLKFTPLQRANVDLLKISSLAYETLYCGKSFATSDQKQILAILSILSPLLESWEVKYHKLLVEKLDMKISHSGLYSIKNGSQVNKLEKAKLAKLVDHESLRFDYYYTQLYIYSLALFNDSTSSQSNGVKRNLRLDELTKAAKYIELAFNAAKEILASATRIHKLKMLRFMPIRWVTRIVRSVAFVVKCYMTLTSHIKSDTLSSALVGLSVIPTDDIIQTVQKAAITLREASPDELHLCTRYSTILMYLCSEMRASAAAAINTQLPKKHHLTNELKKQNQKTNAKKEDGAGSIDDDSENARNLDNSENFTFNPNASTTGTSRQGITSAPDFAAGNGNVAGSSSPALSNITNTAPVNAPYGNKVGYSTTSQGQATQYGTTFGGIVNPPAAQPSFQQPSAVPSRVPLQRSSSMFGSANAGAVPYSQSNLSQVNTSSKYYSPYTGNNGTDIYPGTSTGTSINSLPQQQQQQQGASEYFSSYFDSGLQNLIQSNSWVGLDFVDPFTELLEQQMRDSNSTINQGANGGSAADEVPDASAK